MVHVTIIDHEFYNPDETILIKPKCLHDSTFCEFQCQELFGGEKFVHDIYGNPNFP
jgi:hypothetical protein